VFHPPPPVSVQELRKHLLKQYFESYLVRAGEDAKFSLFRRGSAKITVRYHHQFNGRRCEWLWLCVCVCGAVAMVLRLRSSLGVWLVLCGSSIPFFPPTPLPLLSLRMAG
jgi:hypothetical protein